MSGSCLALGALRLLQDIRLLLAHSLLLLPQGGGLQGDTSVTPGAMRSRMQAVSAMPPLPAACGPTCAVAALMLSRMLASDTSAAATCTQSSSTG